MFLFDGFWNCLHIKTSHGTKSLKVNLNVANASESILIRFVFADPFCTICNKAQLFINTFIFVEFSYISDPLLLDIINWLLKCVYRYLTGKNLFQKLFI